MQETYGFPEEMFATVLGGTSILDIPRLRIDDLQEAHSFISCYGYQMTKLEDVEELWQLHADALQFLNKNILKENEILPELILSREQLKDVGNLLVFASQKEGQLQKWSCALLRVMHVLSHLQNSVFFTFSEHLQKQILSPIEKHIHIRDGYYYLGEREEEIPLYTFRQKKFKSKRSATIKLLAKRNEFGMNLLDRMGLRFITYSVYDSFRVLRYLINQHLISIPNLVSDQTRNNLYPLNLFLEVMDKLHLQERKHTIEEIDALLQRTFERRSEEAEFTLKANDFSSTSYRAIKFIARHMVEIPIAGRDFHFFFPFEVQIMDKETHAQNTTGDSAHSSYKDRQLQAARDRVLGIDQNTE